MKKYLALAIASAAILAACTNANHNQNEKDTPNPNPESTSGAPAGMDRNLPPGENPGSAPNPVGSEATSPTTINGTAPGSPTTSTAPAAQGGAVQSHPNNVAPTAKH
jgi:hypothetical protein